MFLLCWFCSFVCAHPRREIKLRRWLMEIHLTRKVTQLFNPLMFKLIAQASFSGSIRLLRKNWVCCNRELPVFDCAVLITNGLLIPLSVNAHIGFRSFEELTGSACPALPLRRWKEPATNPLEFDLESSTRFCQLLLSFSSLKGGNLSINVCFVALVARDSNQTEIKNSANLFH